IGGEVSFWDWTGGNVEVEKLFRFFLNSPEALPYWLQEARERGEREQRLIEAIKKAQERFKHGNVIMALIEGSMILTDALDTLYPDTPAPKEGESDASLD
ncbi:hypothetical protein, partial [Paenibacillus odorifer]